MMVIPSKFDDNVIYVYDFHFFRFVQLSILKVTVKHFIYIIPVLFVR